MAQRLFWLAASALALALADPASAQAPAGDPMTGRALFIGARAFQRGGSPCGACHAIGGESAPFAASLGPELSASFDGLDAATLDGMLEDTPFPTMVPVYAGHPLTPAERADLSAFLLQASGKPAPGGGRVAAYAGILAAACLVLLGLGARRGKGSTRAALLARARLAPPVRPRRPRAPPAPAATDSERSARPATGRRVHGGAR
jgi:mono/diheme cytochrome c family protein